MPDSRIYLRPHHFMCVHGFKGRGYSPEFVKNFWEVIERLQANEAEVEVVPGVKDSICEPCPNNNGVVCGDEAKINKLDSSYAATLKIKPGDRMHWNQAKQLVAKNVKDEDFEKNCEPCGWKKLGYCKEALRTLRNEVTLLFILITCLAGFAPPLSKADDEPKLANVESLEQDLMLDKSRRIGAFFKIQNALKKGDYRVAAESAKALEAKSEFADYYHYLLGQAELGELKKAQSSGAMATALSAGEKAKYHLSQVQSSTPYTSLLRRANIVLADVEIKMGEVHFRMKRPAKAQIELENGFQRLAQVNLLVTVPKATILSYAIACARKPNELCSSWVAKLTPYVSKGEDTRILEQFANSKKLNIERTPQPVPYKVDLDLQAFQKGFQQYLDGKYVDAFVTFRSLLKDYPRTNIKLRTKFWMARSAQKSAHQLQAETLFREIIRETPFSYYALVSSWYANIDILRMMDVELPMAQTQTALLTPADLFHVKRAETLLASAVPELAQIELQEVKPNSNMPNEFLVYLVTLNNLAGSHQAAFQMLSELSGRSFSGLFSSYGQKLYFPTSHLPLIRSMSEIAKVDPLLIISVVKQESAFNPEAVSVANAYGLMQIIPPTARDLEPGINTVELFEPSQNVKLGARYVRQLLNRYRGNIIAALAAYNAGPGNSDRWIRETRPNSTLDEVIEQISFKETREYVQSILRNYFWYIRRIKNESVPNLQALTQLAGANHG